MRSRPSVLIVDDDPGIRGALRRGLQAEGFAVRDASDGRRALDEIAARLPDVVVLDVAMPGLDGVETVRRIRETGLTLPVCMLSARDQVDDRVAGLAGGADDYVVKPFSVAELAARLLALVRLHAQRPARPLVLGTLTIDPGRRVATRAGRDLGLTAREFDLLLVLAQHAGRVLSRTQLLEQVWGYTWDVESNAVDVFVGYLRRKLEAAGEPRIVQTVRGHGFVLRP
ncbi:response regulator transcription factor [Patulibacter sp. NPDC049589]|uniref:response regulator transcription factor n=1 Tax=Patulibacter sp. NPDC049589 TaxID=3154731 RepID=UPI00342525CE